jgi:putative hydrolase of HD superfamily
VAFLTEADQLKLFDRATCVTDALYHENSAKHNWRVALYALILADQAHSNGDISRVIKMLLVHVLVEIDAGDAPIFGQHNAAQLAHEEAATNPDLQFAKSMDRFQPPNQNLASGGGTWAE